MGRTAELIADHLTRVIATYPRAFALGFVVLTIAIARWYDAGAILASAIAYWQFAAALYLCCLGVAAYRLIDGAIRFGHVETDLLSLILVLAGPVFLGTLWLDVALRDSACSLHWVNRLPWDDCWTLKGPSANGW